VHELSELFWLVFAQLINSRFLLLLLDGGVLLSLGSTREALPGKCALQEVENDMADGLKVVSS
jgi:hypothetical protein